LKGRAEIWRSLKTEDKDEARVRSAQWDARVQRLFQTLRKQGERMTEEEREALVAHWLETKLDEAEDFRATFGYISDDQREGAWQVLSDQLEEAHEALVTNNFRKIEKDADELLKSAGLPALDHDGAEFGRLCRSLLRAKQDYLRMEAERWDGIYKDHRPAGAQHHNRPGPEVTPKPPSGPLLSVVFEKYTAENPHADRTVKPLKAEFQRFMTSIGGDRPIAAVTKAEGRTYKEYLVNERKLSAFTAGKYLGMLSTVFRWADRQGFVPDGYNPINGLAPSKKVVNRQREERRPFTTDELLKVFGSPEYAKQRETNPGRYWIPLLCLFEVCRREEGGQLAVVDIQEENDIPFIRINADAKLGQSLKNQGSRRRVPIHDSLVKLGFLEYVQTIKDAGHVRLFPELTKGHNGYSDPVGKWFGRLIRSVGITDPLVVLHSLRHGGNTKLHGAGVPHNVVNYLLGHTEGTINDRVYTHKELLPLSLLRDGLNKLRYEEVVDEVLGLGLQHVEVKTELHQRDLMMMGGMRTHREGQSMAIHNREDLHAFATAGVPNAIAAAFGRGKRRINEALT